MEMQQEVTTDDESVVGLGAVALETLRVCTLPPRTVCDVERPPVE
jgi:hypothetical protein